MRILYQMVLMWLSPSWSRGLVGLDLCYTTTSITDKFATKDSMLIIMFPSYIPG